MLRRQDPDSSDCGLDLSIKEVFVLIYFPESDPGNEYELFSENCLAYDTWNTLMKGTRVAVKFGKARVHGTVVAVSDDRKYLEDNFNSIVECHQMEIKTGLSPCSSRWLSSRPSVVEKYYIKVTDAATQTNTLCPEDSKPFISTDKNYMELHARYKELEKDNEQLKNEVSDLRSKISQVITILDNTSDNRRSSSSFSDSSEIKVLKSVENSKDNDQNMVQIGPNGTRISQQIYDNINWSSHTSATRKLLVSLFPRSILATHSVTGKASPAFRTKQRKTRLNPDIISDIITIITKKCKVSETTVRSAITAKCCDENKMFRKRVNKEGNQSDQENA